MRLEDNPFYILGVGVDSTKSDIAEKADDKCFDEPELEDEIEKAKGILLNPQRRIEAEISWFPGCSGSAFQQNLAKKFQGVYGIQMGGNALCKLNILRVQLDNARDTATMANKIVAIDGLYNDISPEDIRQWLNQDRKRSKFPEILDVHAVESIWQEYRQDIGQQLQNIIKRQQDPVALANEAALAGAAKGCFGQVLQDFIASYDLSVAGKKDECYDKAMAELEFFFGGENSIEDVDAALKAIMDMAKPVCIMNETMGINNYPAAAGIFNRIDDVSELLWKVNEQGNAIRLLEVASEHCKGIQAIATRLEEYLEKARANYTPPPPEPVVSTSPSISSSYSSSSTGTSTKSYTTSSTSGYSSTTTTSSNTPVNRSGQLSPDTGSKSEDSSDSDAGGCCGCLMLMIIGGACASVGPAGIVVGLIVFLIIGALCDD